MKFSNAISKMATIMFNEYNNYSFHIIEIAINNTTKK